MSAQPPGAVPIFQDGRVEFLVDLRIYRVTALKKTAYRLAARCTATFGQVSESSVIVTLLFPAAVTDAQAQEVVHAFHRELLDQELREQIAQETAPFRDLILAHAYSRTGLPSDDDP